MAQAFTDIQIILLVVFALVVFVVMALLQWRMINAFQALARPVPEPAAPPPIKTIQSAPVALPAPKPAPSPQQPTAVIDQALQAWPALPTPL